MQKNLDDSFNNVITKCQDCVDHREELNDLNLITCKAMGWNKKDWFEIVKNNFLNLIKKFPSINVFYTRYNYIYYSFLGFFWSFSSIFV